MQWVVRESKEDLRQGNERRKWKRLNKKDRRKEVCEGRERGDGKEGIK